MTIIGIDPGSTGALALLRDDGTLAWCARTPMAGDDYDLPAMVTMLRASAASHVAIEQVSAARVQGRQQGGSSMFTFGRGYGIWLGIVAALGLPRIDVRPQTWTKALLAGMPKAETPEQRKANAVRRAQALWPDIQIKFKRDWAFADAVLIAEYARRALGSHTPAAVPESSRDGGLHTKETAAGTSGVRSNGAVG